MTQIKKTYDLAFSQVDLHGDVIDTVHASLHDRTAIADLTHERGLCGEDGKSPARRLTPYITRV